MKLLCGTIRNSYEEFKNVRTVTTCAMFGALAVILGYFTVQIGDFIKIGFSSLPNEAVAWLFGPVAAPLFGAAMDLIKYMIKPTGAFFPGFTLTAAVAGFINGIFLYRKPLKLVRVFGVKLAVILICDIFLNTLWLSVLYGKGFMALLPLRVLKNMIMWPIESVLMFSVIRALESTGIFRLLQTK